MTIVSTVTGVAAASGPRPNGGNLYFQIWFTGAYDPNTRIHFYELSNGQVVGSGEAWGNFYYTPDQFTQYPTKYPCGTVVPEPVSVLIWAVLGVVGWLGGMVCRRRRAT